MGGSSGETPATIDAMADHVAAFLAAIGVGQADVLGFSMGGYVAQALTLRWPELVHRLVLVGTGPRNGDPGQDAAVMLHATREVNTMEDFLYLFFTASAASQAAGRAFWARRHERVDDVDPPSSQQSMQAQLASFADWALPRKERFAELHAIRQPTLIVNGAEDIMVPTINSWRLVSNIAASQLIIYPDAGHAAHFQYPRLFLKHLTLFLDAEPVWS